MRIASSPEQVPNNTIASVGTFDGIHLGHQAILEKLSERAGTLNSESLLITFDPPPPLFFRTTTALLSTPEEKIALVEEAGLQNLLILSFSEAIVQMEPEDFIERVVVDGLRVNEIVIGETHKFGRKKRGDFRLLRELGKRWGFGVDVLKPITHKGLPISSSRVRREVEKGQVDEVGSMLGRDYSFTGKVIKGVGRGKRLEYPTANLEAEDLKLLPPNGVYAVRVELADGSFPAVMNIGTRPTFVDSRRNVEVHLLDFDRALYGEFVKIYCVKRLRDEKAFESEKALKSQIERDLRMAKELL